MTSHDLWPALLVAALASCSPGEAAPDRSASLVPCSIEGVRAPAKCTTVRVPEDRSAPTGRAIDLRVVVLPALAPSPKPDPIFFLAGGPGQAATQTAGFALAVADRLHESRDFVFVDQRGTGASHGLFCEALPDDAPLAEVLEPAFEGDAIALCRDDQDADLRMYTTSIAMEDLDFVREALGHDKINLWGTSYGTRAALVYLRAHGDHVRSAVLDGVAPMSLYLPLSVAKDTDRALDLLFSDCEASAACSRAFPELRGRFHAFLDRLADEPLRATVSHPVTGRREEITLGRAALLSSLRNMLYAPDITALVPLTLDRAMAGDLGPFVAAAGVLSSSTQRTVASGLFLSVVCAEDVPFFTEQDVEREAEGTVLGPGFALDMMRACEKWPRAEVPKSFRDPVTSDAPALLLSGALDPVTPPSWAEDAKKTLPHAASVTIAGTGHNAVSTACGRRIAASFVERGAADDLDASCADKVTRPPFFTTFAGPP